MNAAYVSDSTETFYTRRSGACRTGRMKAAPSPCFEVGPMKHASDNSPRNGETVSDASGLSREFSDLLADEISECQELLNKTVRRNVDTDEIEVRIREARARLELVERAAEKRENGAD